MRCRRSADRAGHAKRSTSSTSAQNAVDAYAGEIRTHVESPVLDVDSAVSNADEVADALDMTKGVLATVWGALDEELPSVAPERRAHYSDMFLRAVRLLTRASESQ